jgi:hypothetical protein
MIAMPASTLVSKQELDNSLEYFFTHYATSPWNVAQYAVFKSVLGTTISPSVRQSVLNYLDSHQDADGSWQGGNYKYLYPTQYSLGAYFMLNATPAHNMDAFFTRYDTWAEVYAYDQAIHPVGYLDGRDVYHMGFCWCTYYWRYPPWMDYFFQQMEQNLSWTTGETHRITHILYSYVVARRQFPNLDGIIDTVLSHQKADGSFYTGYAPIDNRAIYPTSISVSVIKEILTLYPGHRTTELNDALARVIPWTESQYRTQVLDGKVCGSFGTPYTSDPRAILEDCVYCGTLNAGQLGMIPTNADMTFQAIWDKMNIHPPPLWLLAVLELAGIGCLSYYLVKH